MAASAEDCIFCKIVRREAPASTVREDASTLAFMDILPMNTGHVLVIPKAHAEYVEDLPPGAAGPILEAAKEVSGALRASGIRCEAVSFYLANGKEAGQEVFHVHLHLIPRWKGDGFGLRVRPVTAGSRTERNWMTSRERSGPRWGGAQCAESCAFIARTCSAERTFRPVGKRLAFSLRKWSQINWTKKIPCR